MNVSNTGGIFNIIYIMRTFSRRYRRREKDTICPTQTNYRYIQKSGLYFYFAEFKQILINGLENNNNKGVLRHEFF